jgi:hypothetical protein
MPVRAVLPPAKALRALDDLGNKARYQISSFILAIEL